MDRKVLTESKSDAAERTRALRQVSGTVVQTKQVDVRNGGGVLLAMLQTTKGDDRLLVDLGPNQQKLDLSKGEKVAIEGVVTRIGDHQVLVAKRIRADGKTLTIDRESQIRQAGRALGANDYHPRDRGD